MDAFALIAAERRRLADELDHLSPEDWEQPSLCAGWSVHVVVAHLNAPWAVGIPTVVSGLVRSLGNIDRAWDRFSRDLAGRMAPEECIAGLREHAEDRFTPPTLGPEAPLTDVVVHGADALHPLGRAVEVAPEARRTVLEWLATGRTPGFLPRGRRAGLVLEATDLDVRVGEGDAVLRGPAISLAGALLGRRAHLEALDGDGVAVLDARLGPT